jgi:hypothetical protein
MELSHSTEFQEALANTFIALIDTLHAGGLLTHHSGTR